MRVEDDGAVAEEKSRSRLDRDRQIAFDPCPRAFARLLDERAVRGMQVDDLHFPSVKQEARVYARELLVSVGELDRRGSTLLHAGVGSGSRPTT